MFGDMEEKKGVSIDGIITSINPVISTTLSTYYSQPKMTPALHPQRLNIPLSNSDQHSRVQEIHIIPCSPDPRNNCDTANTISAVSFQDIIQLGVSADSLGIISGSNIPIKENEPLDLASQKDGCSSLKLVSSPGLPHILTVSTNPDGGLVKPPSLAVNGLVKQPPLFVSANQSAAILTETAEITAGPSTGHIIMNVADCSQKTSRPQIVTVGGSPLICDSLTPSYQIVLSDAPLSDQVDISWGCQWEKCEQTYPCIEDLVNHVNDAHVRLEKPNMEYHCKWDQCPRKGRGFNARYKMLIHIRTHTNEKPHRCPVCGKCFSRLENLKIHNRSHTGEKPYVCPFEGCNKAYSNSSDRFKHVRTHQEDKPFVCRTPSCYKRYTDPSSLRKHMRTHGHYFPRRASSQVSPKFRLNNPSNGVEEVRQTASDVASTTLPVFSVVDASIATQMTNVALVPDNGAFVLAGANDSLHEKQKPLFLKSNGNFSSSDSQEIPNGSNLQECALDLRWLSR